VAEPQFAPIGATECSHGWSAAEPVENDREPELTRPGGAEEIPFSSLSKPNEVSSAPPGQVSFVDRRFPRVPLRFTRGDTPTPRWGSEYRQKFAQGAQKLWGCITEKIPFGFLLGVTQFATMRRIRPETHPSIRSDGRSNFRNPPEAVLHDGCPALCAESVVQDRLRRISKF
jgi:hypothetical protein